MFFRSDRNRDPGLANRDPNRNRGPENCPFHNHANHGSGMGTVLL